MKIFDEIFDEIVMPGVIADDSAPPPALPRFCTARRIDGRITLLIRPPVQSPNITPLNPS